MKFSIITATCQRPQLLAMQLKMVQNQQLTSEFDWEQIVVSDGPDPVSAAICQHFAVRYDELPEKQGNYGAACRDRGMELATGAYLCFWDDDNYYSPNALQQLIAVSEDVDMGILQVEHWLTTRRQFTRIPKVWTGQLVPGQIDTMCCCLRRELALKEKWNHPPNERGTDHRWLSRLMKYEPKIRFEPTVIGLHMPAVVSG